MNSLRASARVRPRPGTFAEQFGRAPLLLLVAAVPLFVVPLLERELGTTRGAVLAIGPLLIGFLLLRPGFTLCASIFVGVVFAHDLYLPGVPLGFTFVDLTTAVLLLWAALEAARRTNTIGATSPLDLAVGLFLIALMIAAIHGLIISDQRKDAFNQIRSLFPLFLYFPAIALLRTEKMRDRAIFALIIGGTIASLWTIYSVLTNNTIQLELGFPRVTSDINSVYGGIIRTYALTSLNYFPILPLLVLVAWNLRRGWTRVFLVISLAITSTGLLVALNRTNWVLGAVALVLWWFFLHRAPHSRVRLSSAFVVVVIIAAATYGGSLLSHASAGVSQRADTFAHLSQVRGLQYRQNEADTLWHGFLDSPLVGQGLGWHFLVFNPIGNRLNFTTVVHNDFLYMLAEAGPVGFLTFLGMLLMAAMQGWRALGATKSTRNRYVLAGAMAALLAEAFVPAVTHSSLLADLPPCAALLLALIRMESQP